jgi:transcriptional regulator with XRE-family HTH domain
MKTLQALAANIRRLRLGNTLTQAQLAELVGVNVQSISNYENGQRWPQPDVFDLLGKALGVRPWQLLAGESEGGEIPPELVSHVEAAARACGLKVSRPS